MRQQELARARHRQFYHVACMFSKSTVAKNMIYSKNVSNKKQNLIERLSMNIRLLSNRLMFKVF